MPGFQIKALVVTPIGRDKFRLSKVKYVCYDKAEFFFCKRRPLFDALSNVCQTDVWSILVITVIARNRINSVGSL